jgi:transcriptional regulator with XRE-family HTH domain
VARAILDLVQPTTAPRYVAVHGQVLQAIRQSAGRSVREVAGKAGISHQHLSKLERGIHGSTPDVVAALAAVLDIPERILLVAADRVAA